MAFVSIQAESVTYTIDSKTSVKVTGDVINTTNATFNNNTTANNKAQLKANEKMTLTLSGFAGYKIKGITMSMKSNKEAGAGSFSMVAGTTVLASIEESTFNIWYGSYSQSYVDVTPDIKNDNYIIAENEDVVITIAATTNSLYCQSFTIEYEKNTTPEPGITAPSKPTLPASCSFDNSMTVKITNIEEGATVYYTTDGSEPTEENGTKYSDPFEITETTTVKAIAINEAGCSKVVEATYTKNVTEEPETPNTQEVTDELTCTFTEVTSTTYTSWTGKKTSNAIYAGISGKRYDAIQLNNTNSSGIVTTASGGKVKKVVVEWNSNTTNGRTLDIYGKKAAYSAAADLYGNNNEKGTKLGSIVYGTSTELTIEGEYEYIGLRSNSGAMYLTSISITWDASNVVEAVAQPIISPEAAEFKEGDNVTVTITTETEGATIYYTLDGSNPTTENGTEYSTGFDITKTTTVKAIAVKKDLQNSAIATKIFTRVITLENATVADVIAAHKAGDNVESATVIGYIVGSNKVLNSTTEVKTNIIIADNADENDISNCIHVELKKDTDIRTALNLADNPGNYKKKVILTGNNVEGYLDGTGLKNVNSYEFVIEGEWATIFRSYEGVAPAGYEAYIVTGVNNGWATLKQITGVIPAKTGVILKKNENAVADSSVNADVEGNLLMGSIGSEKVTEDAYVLGVVDGVVGLYKAEMNQQDENGNVAWLNNANKAYLPASALGTANKVSFYGFRIDEEENTTAIEEVEIRNENVIYDLSGRRVSEITEKGIYIVGGKKVLVK